MDNKEGRQRQLLHSTGLWRSQSSRAFDYALLMRIYVLVRKPENSSSLQAFCNIANTFQVK
jgi:hypothetical protein